MDRLKTLGSFLIPPALLCFVPALLLVSNHAQAASRCDAPQTRIDRVACSKASESPQALRLYVQRMQTIENLQFSDYVSEEQARAWAMDDFNRAPARNSRVKSATSAPDNPGA